MIGSNTRARYVRHRKLHRLRRSKRLKTWLASQATRLGILEAEVFGRLLDGLTYIQIEQQLPSGPFAPVVTTAASASEVDNGATVTYTFTPPLVAGNPVPTITRALTLGGVNVTSAMSGNTYVATKIAETQALVMTYTASNGVLPNATSVVNRTVAAAAADASLSLDLVINPPSPSFGQFVTLTGNVTGTPVPTAFASLTVTIGGSAVELTGTGLTRTFVARGGALSVSASVTNVQGTANDMLSATIPAAPAGVASIVGFGSSSMAGNLASTTAKRSLNLAAAAFGAGTIRNAGIEGTVLQNSPDASAAPRANNGRDRFATALLGEQKSDRVVISYGQNDLRYTGAPSTFNVTEFTNDLREIMNGLIIGGYTASEIIVTSPNWYPDVTYTVGSAGFTGSNRTIHEQYVAACALVASEYGVNYGDAYALMRDNGGAATIASDDLHPNDLGHQLLASSFLTAAPNNALAAAVVGAASSPSAETVNLAWTAVAGATGYRVELAVEGSLAFTIGADVAPGTSHAFTGVPEGSYRARIRPVLPGGNGPWRFWPAAITVAAIVAVPPANTDAPVVSGSLVQGSTLSTTNGTWTGDPTITFTYQWRRGSTDISGATAATYATVLADVGENISCRVTGTNGAGSSSATSAAVGPITAASGRVVTGEIIFAGQAAGTRFQDITPVSGTPVRHPGSSATGQLIITTDGTALRSSPSTSSNTVATLDEETLGAGVFAEMDLLVRSNSNQLTTYVIARVHPTDLTFIAGGYNGANYRILRYVNGTPTVVATGLAIVETAGATPVVRLEVEAGAQRLYRDDVLVASATIQDGDLGTPGPGDGLGLRMGSGSASMTDTTGSHVTALRVGRLA